jgi:hypothetical protein
MKIEYDEVDKELFSMTPEGRVYLEYNEKVGGEPFNDCCIGAPDVDVQKQYGGIVGLYHECIKQGKTWEELLQTDGKWDEIPVVE